VEVAHLILEDLHHLDSLGDIFAIGTQSDGLSRIEFGKAVGQLPSHGTSLTDWHQKWIPVPQISALVVVSIGSGSNRGHFEFSRTNLASRW